LSVFIFGHRSWHEGLQLCDASIINRVGAEKGGRLFTLSTLLAPLSEALPQFDGFAGIIPSSRHEERTELVGLQFLFAGKASGCDKRSTSQRCGGDSAVASIAI
jgi:hypothetical protein